MSKRASKAVGPWNPNGDVGANMGPKYLSPLALRQAIINAYPEIFNDLIKVAKGELSPGIKREDLTPEMILTARFKLLDKMMPNLKPMSEAELIAAMKDQDQGDTTSESVQRTRELFGTIFAARRAVSDSSGDGGQVEQESPGQAVDRPGA